MQEIIFDYGQAGDKFYICLDGLVDILVPIETKESDKLPVPNSM